MGTGTLAERTNGQTIDESWFNNLRTAIATDFLPRNASGAVTNEAGSLGADSSAWLKAFIESGYWSAGDIKPHHSYNGAVLAGQGWMLCDGRQVTEANYDTEHGAGSWDKYISSSILLNKYLPDFDGKYPVGTDTTTQAGSAAITAVGNASNQINIQHTHTIADHNHNSPTHNHQWYDYKFNTLMSDSTWDSAGNANTIDIAAEKTAADKYHIVTARWTDTFPLGNDAFTTKVAATVSDTTLSPANSLSTTQSIQPESIGVQYYMRII